MKITLKPGVFWISKLGGKSDSDFELYLYFHLMFRDFSLGSV